MGRTMLAAAWACAAAAARDGSRLDAVLMYLDSMDTFDDRDARAAIILAALDLARTTDQREAVYFLAGSNGSDQDAIVGWLDPMRPAERELLAGIAASGEDYPAAQARKSLAKVADLPWWQTHFAFDPTEGLSETEAAKLLPRLQGIIAAGEERQTLDGDRRLVKLISRLPGRAMLAAAEPVLQRQNLDSSALTSLLLNVAVVPGGPALIGRVAGCCRRGKILNPSRQQ